MALPKLNNIINLGSRLDPPKSVPASNGSPIRAGFLSVGESFSKDGKEHVVPEGYKYNIAAKRIVKETLTGALPFASFSKAFGINVDFEKYKVDLYKRVDNLIKTFSAIKFNTTSEIAPLVAANDNIGEPEQVKDESSLLPMIAGMLTGIAERFFIKPLLDAFSRLINWAKRLWTNLKKKFKNFRRTMKKLRIKAIRLFRWGKKMFFLAKDWVKNKLPEGLKKLGITIKEFVIDKAKQIGEKILSLIDGVKKYMMKLFEKSIAFALKVAKSVGGGLAAAGTAIGQAGKTAAGTPVGKLAGKIASKLPAGVMKLISGLKFAARTLPIIGVLLTPIFEALDANDQLDALSKDKDEGKITEKEYNQKSTEIVTQAVLNTIGTTLGTAAGAAILGTLGSVVPVFGTAIGAIAGGVIGGFLGQGLAKLIGHFIRPEIASAINDTDADDAVRNIVGFFGKDVPKFFEDFFSPVNFKKYNPTPEEQKALAKFQREKVPNTKVAGAANFLANQQKPDYMQEGPDSTSAGTPAPAGTPTPAAPAAPAGTPTSNESSSSPQASPPETQSPPEEDFGESQMGGGFVIIDNTNKTTIVNTNVGGSQQSSQTTPYNPAYAAA
jgi:hypothetical protein